MRPEPAANPWLADWLSSQSWVNATHYPGLKSHTGHEIVARQADGFGAVAGGTVVVMVTIPMPLLLSGEVPGM